MVAVDRGRRQQLARIANDIRLRCLRDRTAAEAIADVICAEVPELLPLEAARLARGWSRSEVSARLDAFYETRPDRLGFGVDYSAVDVGHLANTGLVDMWPRTGQDSLDDLVTRVRSA